MTKAQEIRERVEALMAGGTTKAEAFKAVAEERGISLGAVRGAFYAQTRKENGGASRPRKRETTTGDALASAKEVLQRAIENIDREVEAARERAEEAQREYEALQAGAAEKREALEAKIAALEA